MVVKDLFVALFDTAEMRRWNDKLCQIPLTELDKQARKMAIPTCSASSLSRGATETDEAP